MNHSDENKRVEQQTKNTKVCPDDAFYNSKNPLAFYIFLFFMTKTQKLLFLQLNSSLKRHQSDISHDLMWSAFEVQSVALLRAEQSYSQYNFSTTSNSRNWNWKKWSFIIIRLKVEVW